MADSESHSYNWRSRNNLKRGKVAQVMHEYKRGELHSGAKDGPKVTSRKQAVAIALSEARKRD